jgi:hypothetical protein
MVEAKTITCKECGKELEIIKVYKKLKAYEPVLQTLSSEKKYLILLKLGEEKRKSFYVVKCECNSLAFDTKKNLEKYLLSFQ